MNPKTCAWPRLFRQAATWVSPEIPVHHRYIHGVDSCHQSNRRVPLPTMRSARGRAHRLPHQHKKWSGHGGIISAPVRVRPQKCNDDGERSKSFYHSQVEPPSQARLTNKRPLEAGFLGSCWRKLGEIPSSIRIPLCKAGRAGYKERPAQPRIG